MHVDDVGAQPEEKIGMQTMYESMPSYRSWIMLSACLQSGQKTSTFAGTGVIWNISRAPCTSLPQRLGQAARRFTRFPPAKPRPRPSTRRNYGKLRLDAILKAATSDATPRSHSSLADTKHRLPFCSRLDQPTRSGTSKM
ncbi:uncharacterized protein PHACADRAFT_249006 [Phanerochaete carnosa HHB-10118-sp]|uniref:Uncharacterized protein n=1 Tax=Phanerochaete carnosa (strain HHB-10118-sp) TaxID=650164 RepID=K5WIH2_PHACS|nr:uncharacterized protein PHACADRAFT_249006 [Phanerochaete carnosa HHB-10118-sp]EKM58894.1 hypothetical protein PHACADRAFT_249006 [Phanerochaete carnosa HHB-10118-sp]